MKAFEKIEDLLNWLIIGMGRLMGKLIPRPLRDKFAAFSNKLKSFMSALIAKIVQLLITLFAGLKFVPSKLQVLITIIVGKSLELVNKAKTASVSTDTIKKITGPIALFLAALSLRIKTWYLSLKPTTVAIGIVSSATVGIAVLNIYGSSKSIYEKSQEEPVLVKVEPKNLRAEYYKQSEKHLLVNGVTVPIYVGKGNAPRTLILDFTMLMSNRYLKSFFYEKDFLLKDRLNTHFEPVIPTLPLEEEGKRIIKEKMIYETNELIKELGIQGEVEDVYFHTIING